MSGTPFRNLLSGSMLTDDSCQPLLRKIDEYRKGAGMCGDQLALIARHIEASEGSLGRLLTDWTEWGEGGEEGYYGQYIQLFRNIHGEQIVLKQAIGREMAVYSAQSNSAIGRYHEQITGLQAQLRSYSSNEQILQQLSKKYFRTHKNMLTQIDAYKDSFTDVKLIYNQQQKTKRYAACESTYQTLHEQLTTIQGKMKELTQKKQTIADAFKGLVQQMPPTVKSIAQQAICFTKKAVAAYCHMLKITITYQAEKKFTLQKLQLHSFLHQSPECQALRCPRFMVEENLNQEGLLKAIDQWAREVEQLADERRKVSRRMLEFTENFVKQFDRCWHAGLKQLNAGYDKIKKRLGEVFGNRFCSFLKSIHSIFEVTVGINQKMLKELPPRLKALQNAVNEETNITEMCLKEVSNTLVQLKRKPMMQPMKQANSESPKDVAEQENGAWRKKVRDKGEYLVHLVEGFGDKLQKKGGEIKEGYGGVLKQISVATNELYSLCLDYEQLYFGEHDYQSNCVKFEADISKSLSKEESFFQSTIFASLLQQKQPEITFQSQIGKIQQFKKLKKPTEIEIENESVEGEKSEAKKRNSPKNDGLVGGSDGIVQKRQQEMNPTKAKEMEFLQSKITLRNGEEYIQSYSCAMSDKVLLQGRLYITNKRLCFHSIFNPQNLFFGGTFIQIPKKDILKIQKRVNAIVFDNSISLTTINGQVFLTSFVHRNAAYDSIVTNLEIGSQENKMFEEEEEIKQEIQQEQVVEAPQVLEDDLKDNQIAARAAEIDKLLTIWPYKPVYKSEVTMEGLNAHQLLKILEVGQLKWGRNQYQSFLHYHREVLQHRNVSIGEWKPRIQAYLNPSNIKSTTPMRFQKSIDCMVPVANSGVPFMPKQAKSHEQVTLFIYSKDKYVIESVIQNSGVPYADSFNLRLKRVVQTGPNNSCILTFSMHINFLSSPMIKSIIESKSLEETKNGMVKLTQQLSKYLAHLTKQRKKTRPKTSTQKQDGAVQPTANTQAIEEYEREVKQLRESETALKKQLGEKQAQFESNRKILIASVVLNILLIMILIR